MKIYPKTLLIAGVCISALLNTVNAAVIFQENFNGLSTDNLATSTPDITTDSISWVGSTRFKQDGSFTGGGANWLALSGGAALQTSTTYSISLTFDMTGSGSTSPWAALGFTTLATPTGAGFNSSDNPVHWFLARPNGGQDAFAGTGVAGDYGTDDTAGFFTPGANTTMSILLETGVNLNASTLSMSIDGNLLDLDSSSVAFSAMVDASTFTHIGFGASNTGTINSFKQFEFSTAAIPEPSTYAALTGLFALGAVALRRRRA